MTILATRIQVLSSVILFIYHPFKRSRSMTHTFYWHDYEAGGVNPRVDRPMQFAGIRTDENLDVIGEPLNIFCQLAPDYLPHPEACLITGISPQRCQRDGYIEAEFAQRIAAELEQPNTVTIGYNNLRYDDEMTRFLFYRNFRDPYAHTWQNNNSRWDLLELVRACYALRPDGIQWPQHEDGRVSLKLEDLARENKLDHGQAHDAMSDVYATIGLAKLIKQAQPKLFDWGFSHRHKAYLQQLVDQAIVSQQPLVHVSGFYGTTAGYCRWIMPLGYLQSQPNTLVAWRLDCPLEPWLASNPNVLAEALYQSDVPANERPGIVKIALNQAPFLAPFKTWEPERAAHFGQQVEHSFSILEQLKTVDDFKQRCIDVFEQNNSFDDSVAADPDVALYSGGLFSRQSQAHIQIIRETPPERLAAVDLNFEDARLDELLFRYRARNYPQTLSEQERQRWRSHCQERLQFGSADYLSIEEFGLALEQAAELYGDQPNKLRILKDLFLWAQAL
ncbi:MAG: exodeoxyribonuclease I [Idiomarina sp.]|nr:exodeoxyribonuclease I [Idiomarina sp.]